MPREGQAIQPAPAATARYSHPHPPVKNADQVHRQRLSLGGRLADAFARTVGSWVFITAADRDPLGLVASTLTEEACAVVSEARPRVTAWLGTARFLVVFPGVRRKGPALPGPSSCYAETPVDCSALLAAEGMGRALQTDEAKGYRLWRKMSMTKDGADRHSSSRSGSLRARPSNAPPQ